jgi:ferredoxin
VPPVILEADSGTCIGSGMCALTAPGLFDQSQDDGTVVLLKPVPADFELGDARDAVRRCPSGALKLTD